MSEIDAVQGRIMAALDRIAKGLDGLSPQTDAPDAEALEELRGQLEDEKLANAQLQERVKALNARTKAAEDAAEAAATQGAAAAEAEAERNGRLRKLDAELQSLRMANQQLRDNNAALREANETGVVEPHLINKAMMAELEGLRAARAADRAEMDVILAELDDAVGSVNDHADSGAGDTAMDTRTEGA